MRKDTERRPIPDDILRETKLPEGSTVIRANGEEIGIESSDAGLDYGPTTTRRVIHVGVLDGHRVPIFKEIQELAVLNRVLNTKTKKEN